MLLSSTNLDILPSAWKSLAKSYGYIASTLSGSLIKSNTKPPLSSAGWNVSPTAL